MTFSRRHIIAGAATLGVGGLIAANSSLKASAVGGLAQYAEASGRIYGSAVRWTKLSSVAEYRRAIVEECGAVVPEYEMKWGAVEHVRGQPNYSAADSIVAFAKKNKMAVRGHAAIWGTNLPPWLGEAMRTGDPKEILKARVQSVMSRYAGSVLQWDVVNEAIEPMHNEPDGLRKNLFFDAIGPDYIALAFRAAREADPAAKLYYNDYGVEYNHPKQEPRRKAILALLRRLISDGVPIDGFGIQSHLLLSAHFSEEIFGSFLAEVSDLGLDIMLTELDVNDSSLIDIPLMRSRIAAAHVSEYLKVAFANPKVKGMLTWGISSALSSLNEGAMARKDGSPTCGLPLDTDYKRTPVWDAIANAFKEAPTLSRRGTHG